jgi:hypothetical protein
MYKFVYRNGPHTLIICSRSNKRAAVAYWHFAPNRHTTSLYTLHTHHGRIMTTILSQYSGNNRIVAWLQGTSSPCQIAWCLGYNEKKKNAVAASWYGVLYKAVSMWYVSTSRGS